MASLDELQAKSQRYNGQLQEYNTKLQARLSPLSPVPSDVPPMGHLKIWDVLNQTKFDRVIFDCSAFD